MQTKTVLILGINGFTGKYFLKHMESLKHSAKFSFIGVDIKEGEDIKPQLRDYKFIKKDLSKKEELEEIIKETRPEYIINFVGIYGIRDPDRLIKINAEITRNLLECLIREELKPIKILLIGSAAEYGRVRYLPIDESHPLEPIGYYGLSKVIQEEYADFYFRVYNLHINIARTFNLIGSGLPETLAIGRFYSEIMKKSTRLLEVGNLDTKRDYIDIRDAVDAYWKILLYGKPGEKYNVCSGTSYSIGSVLKKMIGLSGRKIDIKINEKYIRKNDIMDIYGSYEKIMKDTGWTPSIPMEKSIEDIFGQK